jgi:hypothetical protein
MTMPDKKLPDNFFEKKKIFFHKKVISRKLYWILEACQNLRDFLKKWVRRQNFSMPGNFRFVLFFVYFRRIHLYTYTFRSV